MLHWVKKKGQGEENFFIESVKSRSNTGFRENAETKSKTSNQNLV